MKEKNIQTDIMIGLSKAGAVIFRNNVGIGWVGKVERQTVRCSVNVGPGDVVIRSARPLHAGLCEGSSDLIGWRSVTITPEMVGDTIAQFIAPEVKTGKEKPRANQVNFIDAVNSAGGRAGVVRSADEAVKLIFGDDGEK